MKNLLTIYTTLVAFLMFVTVSALILPSNTQTSNASTIAPSCFKWVFDARAHGEVINDLWSPATGSLNPIYTTVQYRNNLSDYPNNPYNVVNVKVIDPYINENTPDLRVGLGKVLILDGGTHNGIYPEGFIRDAHLGGDFVFLFNGNNTNVTQVKFTTIDMGDELDGKGRINNNYYIVTTVDGKSEKVAMGTHDGQNLPDKYVWNHSTRDYGQNIASITIHFSGSAALDNFEYCNKPQPSATPKPTASATPKPTATATPKPTATATPKPTATATPKPTATATPKPTATATPKPTATATPKPTATSTPEPTATATPKPTATATPEPSITPSPTATSTPIPTATVTPTFTPTVTVTPIPTATITTTPIVTPTVTITVTPSVTATPVITPTPPVFGDDTVFGFNISKEVVGKLKYQVGELILFNVNFKNTGTEKIEKLYLRDIYTTDMRAESVLLVHNGEEIDVTSLFFRNIDDMDTGMILPKNPVDAQQLLNLIQLTGPLEEGEELTLQFTFKAVSKNELVCNQAYTSPNGRKEISSSKVCVEIDAIVPVTD